MRRIGFALAAIVVAGALAPAAVISAPKDAEISEASRKQGMAEAPAVAQAAGIACQVQDARFIGKSQDKKTKVSTAYYEIDCDKGLGFVVQTSSAEAKPSAFNCLETSLPGPDGKVSGLACKLPGNADMVNDVTPLVQKAGAGCTVEKARSIGQTASNAYLEVLCQGGAGYILQAGSPPTPDKEVTATNCLLYDEASSNLKCELADKATRLAVVDTYAAQAANGCTVKDKRYMLTTKGGETYFEAACEDGKGYVYKIDAAGQLAQTIDCAKADFVGGGCTLTDARAAQTEQAGLYTKLSKAAGFDCEVSKYAPLPGPTGKDVVELQCGNRPDGAIGIFAANAAESVVHDCAHAQVAGYRCVLTKSNDSLLTADLKKLGKTSCEVKESRLIGKTSKGTAFLEVNCTDGLAGYMIEYNVTPKIEATGATGCAFAKGIAGGCKLPGNT
ncbi:MAG: hypothetical protein ACK4YQ_14580 [Phenylobacterium sp.]|uniref:hypothetical protein n=1 Tax=Phenylobacterium sp. TaxID=1871053 RepID=UPI003919036E